ncbi:hypothetical protein GLYMA_14G067151v4 [Glycine max]|nr:hypothetical protein GLYMA_14G067151v4 [Glycine max]
MSLFLSCMCILIFSFCLCPNPTEMICLQTFD